MDISAAISTLSDKHLLTKAPLAYLEAFVKAAEAVYPAQHFSRILQEKFFIPRDEHFSVNHYFQSAAELSAQNHLKLDPRAKGVAIERQINPPKDVDVFYQVGQTRVALEVKCAVELQPSHESLVFKTAGRVPDHMRTFADLKAIIEGPRSHKRLELAKNKDNTMKDFLVSANQKVCPAAGVDDLNVLLIACGGCGNIQEWWHYLYGGEGLFTAESFYPVAEYRLVDAVLLSNLKYLHSDCRDLHDWTLRNAFLPPCINPHGRSSLVSDSIRTGLSVFNHHLYRFAKYTPEPIHRDTPDYAMEQVKVFHYVARHLDHSERMRYFPVKPGPDADMPNR